MTEKEKAQAGLLYDANYDQALMDERMAAKRLLFAYNQTPPDQAEERRRILRNLLGKLGESYLIEQPFYCDYGYDIFIGENFYANFGCVMLDGAKITIGDHVFFAPYVGLYTAGHPLEPETRNQGLEYAYPIAIGDDVWIGAGVQILPGVTIGSGTTIGAGSVVTRDMPAGVLAAGNPCRVIRVLDEKRSV